MDRTGNSGDRGVAGLYWQPVFLSTKCTTQTNTAVARRRRSGSRTGGARESTSGRYSHSVPDATTILQALEQRGVPVDFDVLAAALGVSGERATRALRRNLQKMAASGRLLINRKSEYCLPAKIGVVVGTVSAHADGFGFLVPDEGDTDIFLSYHEMRQLLHGDRVAVHATGVSRGKPAGTVVEILERGKQSAVGHYLREHGVGYVVEAGRSPHSFVIPNHHRADAQPGDLVKLEIIEYPTPHREAQGKVVKVLGKPEDPGMITDVAIEQFDIAVEFPPDVVQQAQGFGDQVSVTDLGQREDLREMPLITH